MGTRSIRQAVTYFEANAGLVPGAGAAGRPLFQKFGVNTSRQFFIPMATNRYDAWQSNLIRRFSGGLFLTSSYTWSETIGVNAGNSDSGLRFYVASQFPKNRAVADFDRTHTWVSAANYELAALPQTGSILREYWTNSPGKLKRRITWESGLSAQPDGVEYLAIFEARGKSGGNFGERIRAYLHPPKTGDYTFWIAGDGFARFLLSRDDQPRNKVWIATSAETKKSPREWTNQGKQQSSAITLTAGRKYYIEAVQNDAGKGDHHLAVAWQGPERQLEVIPGEFLSPLETKTKEKKGK